MIAIVFALSSIAGVLSHRMAHSGTIKPSRATELERTPTHGFNGPIIRSIGSEENMRINFSRGYELIGRRLATRSRRLGRMFARYRNARRSMRVSISRRSQRGLDWMNFFLADVQTGFGAFVAFYLADLGWPKDQVGLALTAGTLAGVLCQAPGGALVDAIHWKRGLVAIGIGMICVSALIFALLPSFPLVFAAEILHGLAGGIVTPAIAAISLGLVGRRAMSS